MFITSVRFLILIIRLFKDLLDLLIFHTNVLLLSYTHLNSLTRANIGTRWFCRDSRRSSLAIYCIVSTIEMILASSGCLSATRQTSRRYVMCTTFVCWSASFIEVWCYPWFSQLSWFALVFISDLWNDWNCCSLHHGQYWRVCSIWFDYIYVLV